MRDDDSYCEVIVRRGQEVCKRVYFVVHPERKRPSSAAPVEWDEPSILFIADFQTTTIVEALDHIYRSHSDTVVMEECETPVEFDVGISVLPIQVTDVQRNRAIEKVFVNVRNSIQILYVSGICKNKCEIEEYLLGQIKALLQEQ